MRIYFTLFNFCAWNFGAFYSAKYRRLYVQLIPCLLCLVVVIGRQRAVYHYYYRDEVQP